ncbi:hypothetical protein A2276_07835 [candidate division WOR-1 bacterium RIFOXYA12_FULL_43_27]|uniref:SLH domain-containing protein n=1 Tax=candidate division WOR-1 bacterium RIFOXYC2_FULL_46_14 TaxID=1802587 RepID=A0A1F4U600_UNCSA|nr:MAG: hypothetical protein A2276_07835 [candidate division WOR-1 bacterium RIFOXYA12_FULL_43_27]OGC20508.1 MAG: hypothetical protein A2292_05660 [candidate division WOR-1 bacterium RIFOXYB2_FULL_46_45]OGC31755.1 MAG: hypothetical protein A2232_05790 [candidate division WOR-1 bacterium RIFOXYA2_FULL_46_56]OGC40352.1 MAG: hypothetical protein A2438_03680 [candidate division WOR-1 bacterium RIFOXYC2_FULL_46_14]
MHIKLLKVILIAALLAAGAYSSSADDRLFRDMQEKHWAEEQVYSLVKLGLTNGFPDGTFRGEEKVTRYELAGFLSKIYYKFGLSKDDAKLAAELKNEFNIELYRQKYPDHPKLEGKISADLLYASGLALDPRIVLLLKKQFEQGSFINLNFDSIDAFSSETARNIIPDLFDFEAGIKNLYFSFGSGDLLRGNSSVNSLWPGEVYRKLRPDFGMRVKNGKMNFLAGYSIPQISSEGTALLNSFYAGADYTLGKTDTKLTVNYVSKDSNDVLWKFKADSDISEKLKAGLELSGSKNGRYLGATLQIINLKLSAYKVGSGFGPAFAKYPFLPLNTFNKYIMDGTCDLGLEYFQPFGNKNISVKILADLVLSGDYKYGKDYPGTSLTSEFNFLISAGKNTVLKLFYQGFFVPSGLNYADPTLAVSVPTKTNVVGLGVLVNL